MERCQAHKGNRTDPCTCPKCDRCGYAEGSQACEESHPERLWQMIRLGPGDYLLPSNDRKRLWRIEKYPERDGTLTRGDTGQVVNGDFWRLSECTYAVNEVTVALADDYGDAWSEVACMQPTRQACIDYALELDQREQVSR